MGTSQRNRLYLQCSRSSRSGEIGEEQNQVGRKDKEGVGFEEGRCKETAGSPPEESIGLKRKEEAKKGGQQTSKASFSFVICYNCRGRVHTRKSCTSASRVVSKIIDWKAGLVEKVKKQMKIIDDDRFTKVFNT